MSAPIRSLTPRPLIGIAIGYLLGTWLGFAVAPPGWRLLVFAGMGWFLALGAAAVRHARATGRSRQPAGRAAILSALAMHVCILFLAWHRAGEWQAERRPDPGLAPGEPVVLRGRVVEDPSVRPASRGGRVGRFTLRLMERQVGPAAWSRTRGDIRVTWYGWPTTRAPRYGETWELRGNLTAPTRAPDADDARRLRRARNYGVSVTRESARRIGEAEGWDRMVQICYAGRAVAAEYLSLGIEEFPETVGLLQAILLGRRQMLSSQAWNAFVATGTLHIFAVSGGHVAILALLLVFVFRILRVSRERWGLGIVPILIVYTLATGAPSSAVRACVTGVIYFAAPLLGRKPDALTALAASALAILAAAPDQIFDVGFILSFAVVLGLILLYPRFERPLRRLWEPDPLRLQPEARAVRLWRAAGRQVAALAAMSGAAWVVSTPLTAYLFGRISLVAIVGNVLIVPLAFFVMLTGSLSILAGGWLPLVADVFNHANLLLVGAMVQAAGWLSRVPGGNVEGWFAPGWLVALWYVALGLALVWQAGGKTTEGSGTG